MDPRRKANEKFDTVESGSKQGGANPGPKLHVAANRIM